MIEVVPLNPAYLEALLKNTPLAVSTWELQRAYFSQGSAALCLLSDGEPVFAGGIVNLMWHRGEAWILPTVFFRTHVKTCLKELRDYLPVLARECGFERVQATCVKGISDKLFAHMGFEYEGTLKRFGPNGETCGMWSRVFEG